MWAVLGADQGEKWPWLEREGDLGRDLDRKVALARAGKAGKEVAPAEGPEATEARNEFVL